MSTSIFFDLETGSAKDRHTYGPGFSRLAAWAVGNGSVHQSADMRDLVPLIQNADHIIGHNILAYDLPVLEPYGLDMRPLVEEGRVHDTLLMARHAEPPISGGKRISEKLEDTCKRYGVGEKLKLGGESALKRLAREFGGFDQIPTDHPEYCAYNVQDVVLVRDLARLLPWNDYLVREHKVLYRLGFICRNGWLVDTDLARRVLAAQQAREATLKQHLIDGYGMPAEGKKPHATNVGKIAIEKAFIAAGVEPPRTPKGNLATGREALEDLIDDHADNDKLVDLCQTLLALNGVRSTVGTILDNTHSDGRIHPDVNAKQATGRISVTDPGLTVLGKRARRNVLERALLVPDPGEVLISFDLSQIDARAIAADCQDPAYLAAFDDREKDFHSEVALMVFGDKDRRDDAKPVTHASTYGIGAAKHAERTGVDILEAQRQLQMFETQYQVLAARKAELRAQAEALGGLTNSFGRPMRIKPGKEYTQAPAMMGQGTARDLMMEGILRLPEWLLPCLRAIVHDEIVLSVPENRVDEAESAVLDALEFSFTVRPGATPVPIYADKSDRGRDWADCYRSEKAKWPEVARDHRDQPDCDAPDCTWHVAGEVN